MAAQRELHGRSCICLNWHGLENFPSMRIRSRRTFATLLIATGLLGVALPWLVSPALAKANTPVPASTTVAMRDRGMATNAPILVRVFKRESELEVWKQRRDGRYALLKTFPVCRWSGRLGPKRKNGDRQSPEGFYDITPKLMNPKSSYHLSFDTGFPNAYDRANGYTGSYLMVHGVCSSMGCYAMTNDGVEEIFALMRDAFRGGQQAVQFQAYPFRMNARNMARMRDDPEIDFWRQLKSGYDRFDATSLPPAVRVSGKRYAFLPYKDRKAEETASARLREQQTAIQQEIDDGAPSVRVTYSDGAMHPYFARMRNRAALGLISRPEALALAGRDVIIRQGVKKLPAVMVAGASGAVSVTFASYWEHLNDPAPPGAARPAPVLPPTAMMAAAPASSPAPRIALAHDGAAGAMASATYDAGALSGASAPSWTRIVIALAGTSAIP